MVVDQVQDELDALAARLGRSLTIDGMDGDLIAYSTQRDDADAARISSILLRHVAPEIREWEERHIDVAADDPIPVPANPEIGMSARLCVPLRRRGRCLGYLWMLGSGGELTAPDLAALRGAASAMADLLDIPVGSGGHPVASGRDVDRLVRRLFDEGQAEACSQLAVAVPGIVDGTVQLLAAVAADPGDGGIRPLRSREFSTLSGALTPILRAAPDYVGSSVSTTHVPVVLHRGADRPGDDGLVDQIAEVVTRCLTTGSALTLGLSEPRPFGLDAAHEARTQALAAAELAALDPALNRHSSWSDLGPYRNLIGANRLSDAALAPLDGAGTSAPMLLRTLEAYLDLGGDAQATSARLNLHRSSLYYRLDRISRLLGSDLSDGLVRLDLHLALKGRRVRRRTLGRG
ncbi:MAG TPA: helix-turn-helix domain-containing protein [Pseudonocardia sp.]|nr:helix-turn-helix domain-containing protein [Pseudonocardia sp.]